MQVSDILQRLYCFLGSMSHEKEGKICPLQLFQCVNVTLDEPNRLKSDRMNDISPSGLLGRISEVASAFTTKTLEDLRWDPAAGTKL